MHYIGIDLGTSEVKTVIMDGKGAIVATESKALSISRKRPNWSEQNPAEWWEATLTCIDKLKQKNKSVFKTVKGIGLSGQMHGAILLDKNNKVLRPAILWNDTRSDQECKELTKHIKSLQRISGNIAMPGFTAPKLVWVKKYEPQLFAKTKTVLLPKDYINFLLTGNKTSDMSDASGTLWLDVKNRRWSAELLKGSFMKSSQMPVLLEGNQQAGILTAELRKRWGFKQDVIVAAGAGDNAASAIGVGAVNDGNGFISLGTSGVIFVAIDKYRANAKMAVHTFCHALPNRWHQMSVMLSAASSLRWYCNLIGVKEAELLTEIEKLTVDDIEDAPLFLPYLSGERTPHNSADAKGVFFGLTHNTNRSLMGYAVIEGVSFGLKDGLSALQKAGTKPSMLSLLGGGSRSDYWAQLLATILDVKITTHKGGESLAALGAAKLAAMACGVDEKKICNPLPLQHAFLPDKNYAKRLTKRYKKFQQIYKKIQPLYK
jgi:xylulokinase